VLMREYAVLVETDSLAGLSHSLGCLTRWVVSLAGEIRYRSSSALFSAR
jgi:hypothetical protein